MSYCDSLSSPGEMGCESISLTACHWPLRSCRAPIIHRPRASNIPPENARRKYRWHTSRNWCSSSLETWIKRGLFIVLRAARLRIVFGLLR